MNEDRSPLRFTAPWMGGLLRLPRPGFLFALSLVIAMSGGMALERFYMMASVPSSAASDFHLMAEAWNTIDKYYVDRSAVRPSAMTYGAISGMVNALGDTGHSVFLSPSMVKQLRQEEKGRLKGIGIEIQMKSRHVVIVAPIDGSPAQRAGLRPGDIILKVNGKDIAGLPLSQVVSRISGPAGTSVSLTILNPRAGRTRDITLVRSNIKLHEVTWQRLPGTTIADLRIASFDEGVSDSLKRRLKAIQQDGVTGLILDLRNNPGGILDEAVDVASQFLDRGNVLLVKNARGKVTPVAVKPNGLAPHLPMIVLVNDGTASAAEIVAGALQDAHRAKLLGDTTFGTGTVLQEFHLTGGSALLLAVEEWLTPSGHSFWHKGLTPDIKLALSADAMPLVPAAERDMSKADLQSSGDNQLLEALKRVSKLSTQEVRANATGSIQH